MTTTSVTSGETSRGITLSNGDFLLVYSGGIATSTTVSSGGIAEIFSGGVASFTTVSDGGSAVVSSGGTASFTTISNGGYEIVSNGGVASFTTVSDGGSAVVSKGGAANFTTISFGGTEDVYSGGTTSFTTVSGGSEYVYSGGTASFTVDDSTVVLAGGTAISTTVGGGGDLLVSDGGRAISTTVENGGVQFVSFGGTASFTTVSDGDVEVSSGGTTFSTTIDGLATENVNSGGRAVSTTVDSGGIQQLFLSGTASDTTLSDGGAEDVYGHARAISTTISGGGTVFVFVGAIARDTVIDPGGQIDVTYLSYAAGGSATVNSSDLLIVSVGGQTYSQQLSGDYAADDFRLSLDKVYGGTLITNEAPCYRSGTRILTDRGEVAIEDLRLGDLVQTVLGEATAPIIWIGRRDVDCARHPKPRQVWPIRVAAGAFGPGRPHTDLYLSPDHAVYIGEVLIPIRYLINASTITQVPMDQVTYYHLELPQHEVVLAQGLPAESFLDLKDGSNYANRPGPIRLYPDYTVRMWEAFGCARLIVTGPELIAARALVGRFAGEKAATLPGSRIPGRWSTERPAPHRPSGAAHSKLASL